MIRFLILYVALSSIGWVWIIMGASTHRAHRKVTEQERSRATARVVDLVPEKKTGQPSPQRGNRNGVAPRGGVYG